MNAAPPSFCKSWFRAKKRATEMWDAERAREAHDTGSPYAALIGSADRPTHFVEVNTASNFFGVGFLDEHLREYMYYAFTDANEGVVFLSTATFRDFEGETDQVVKGTTYVFRTSGEVAIQRVTFRPQYVKETASARADVSSNYEKLPSFGSYDALLKRERAAGPK